MSNFVEMSTINQHTVYKNAVDESIQSMYGHLDLLLCFPLGLLLESIQTIIGLRTKTKKSSQTNEDTRVHQAEDQGESLPRKMH